MEESPEDKEKRLRDRRDAYMSAMRSLDTYKENAMKVLKSGLQKFSNGKKDYVYVVGSEDFRFDYTRLQLFEQQKYWSVSITIDRRVNQLGGSLLGSYSYYATLVLVIDLLDPTPKSYKLYVSYDKTTFTEFGTNMAHNTSLECINIITSTLNSQLSGGMSQQYMGDDALAWHAINRLAQVIENIRTSRKIQ